MTVSVKSERTSGSRELPARERLLLPQDLARQYIGVSKTRLYEYAKEGLLETVKIRGRRLWVVESLNAFVEQHRKGEAA